MSGVEKLPIRVVSFSGRQSYRPLWDLQKRLWRARYEGRISDTLLLLEHEPVVTLGRNARRENLLLSESEYAKRGVELVDVNRGGDVTYHGPGQLVGYWIFDLRQWKMDVHAYLRSIEEVLIRTLGAYGIEGRRDEKATGVWVEKAKVAAIGLHLSHWVSTHGFALNVDADLAPFGWIIPCGLTGRPVTSMTECLGRPADRGEVEAKLIPEIENAFDRDAQLVTELELERELQQLSSTEGETPARLLRMGAHA